MIKNIISYTIVSMFLLVSCQTATNDKEYDTRAITTLDSLSSVIGELNSCSFSLDTELKNSDNSKTSVNQHDVYMRGPNKMYIHSNGNKGEKGYWYNGKQLAFLNYTKSTFDTISAPDNIISTIDFIHNKYGVDFPAGDFFYPTLTDDVIENYNKVFYIGNKTIDNIECVAISAYNGKESLYIWVDKRTYLPYKMVIEKIGEPTNIYEATFSNWKINPNLHDLLFQFTPKSTSTRVKLISKK
jgi:hypothetical protein